MKTCLFQGTFNPPHNGHLYIAEFVLKNTDYDEVLFVPAYKPPHKSYREEDSFHRLKMTQLLAENKNGLRVSDIEFQREEPSYTYVTVKSLKDKKLISDNPAIIIGDDAFNNIESWYKTEELKKIVKFLLMPRKDGITQEKLRKLKEKGYNFIRLEMPFYDISSTQIRDLISEDKPTDNLIPDKIRKYINENNLYKYTDR